MKTKDKFSQICSYQSSRFKEWFGEMKFEKSTTKLYSMKLPRYMTDQEILEELKPTEVSLGNIFFTLQNASKKDWMIFFVRDINGVLRAVRVSWYGDGWDVYASSVEDARDWRAGFVVFSRNSFDTQVNLNFSDPLSLENRVKKLEHHMEKIRKVINY